MTKRTDKKYFLAADRHPPHKTRKLSEYLAQTAGAPEGPPKISAKPTEICIAKCKDQCNRRETLINNK